MIGMDAVTGKPMYDTAHLSQSIGDILSTPIGSRVMRRDYGSALFELVDAPGNALTITHGLSPSGKPNPACHLRMAPPRQRPANDSHPSRRRGPEVPPPAANEDSPADEATV
jgi:hypothetical protein